MKAIRCSLVIAALIATATGTTHAHHSLSAYDITKTVEIEGTVKRFEWSSPHCWLVMAVPNGHGETTQWVLEAGTPIVNYRYGWKRDDFKAGDKLKVTAFPVRDGSMHGAVMRVTFANGKVLEGPLSTYLKK